MKGIHHFQWLSPLRVFCIVLIGIVILPISVFAISLDDFTDNSLTGDRIKEIKDQLSQFGITDAQRQELENQLAGRPLTSAEHNTLRNLLRSQQVEEQLAKLRAQLAEVILQMNQITSSLYAANIHCPILTYRLGKEGYRTDEDTEGQVSELQRFLARYPDIYPEGLVTGFHGVNTRKAVKRFQVRHGIINQADWDAFNGNVGPNTRKKIAAICEPGTVLKNPEPGQTLRVVDPNGGEVWDRRDDYTLRFENIGNLTGKARIFLMNVKRSRQWIIAEVDLQPGINEYRWFIAGGDIDNEEEQEQHTFLKVMQNPGPSEHDKIQVCAISYALCDESDSQFEIKARRALLSVYPKIGNNDGPDIDADAAGGLLIGKNIQYISTTTNSDGTSLEFADVPFGTYILSVTAPGYRAGVNRHLRINTFWAPPDPDLGGMRHRNIAIGLVPDSYVFPAVTIKTPDAGEPLIIGATTTIEWRSTRKNFKVYLLTPDQSQTWLLAETSTSNKTITDTSSGVTQDDAGDPTGTPGTQTTIQVTPKSIAWEIGKCYNNQPCSPPVPPGEYKIHVVTGAGEVDGLSGTVHLYPPGKPFLTITHDTIDLGSQPEHIHYYIQYDPDGPLNPLQPVDVTEYVNYYGWRTSNFDIADRHVNKHRVIANGPGTAYMRVRYRGAIAYIVVKVGGTRANPFIQDITHSYPGEPPIWSPTSN